MWHIVRRPACCICVDLKSLHQLCRLISILVSQLLGGMIPRWHDLSTINIRNFYLSFVAVEAVCLCLTLLETLRMGFSIKFTCAYIFCLIAPTYNISEYIPSLMYLSFSATGVSLVNSFSCIVADTSAPARSITALIKFRPFSPHFFIVSLSVLDGF